MSRGIHSTYNPYGKNLARQKQRRFFLKIFGIAIMFLILAVSAIYLLFFSSWMRIEEINLNGLRTIESAEIFSIIDSLKDQTFFGKLELKPQLNILFFDDKYLSDKITREYTVIENVEILKEFPHKLVVNIKERTPIGTWCLSGECYYFDNSGTLWGKALRSSGSLLLSVDDLRVFNDPVKIVDMKTFRPIIESVNGLDTAGLKITKVEIPEGSIGDFRLYSTNGYYLMFNNETKITKQTKILKILLDEKGTDFNPTYIDLRIEGRIYYK